MNTDESVNLTRGTGAIDQEQFLSVAEITPRVLLAKEAQEVTVVGCEMY